MSSKTEWKSLQINFLFLFSDREKDDKENNNNNNSKKKVKQQVSFEFNSVHCKHFYDYFLFLLLK